MSSPHKIAFRRIADAALGSADLIVRRWLPEGRREGAEWVARNPTRADRKLGSFKINVRTGAWADFATGQRGGDLISLAAYVHHMSQADAAVRVAAMLGIDSHEH